MMPSVRSAAAFVLIILALACPTGRSVEGPATVPAAAPVAIAPTSDPAQRLSTAARRLLLSVKKTGYAHRTTIDEDAGSYVTDCSGLVSWLLRQDLPAHLAAIPIKRGRSRPLAADFQEAFAAGVPGWQRIARVQDVQPGDVLAWRLLDPQPGRSTGHVMIIDAPAAQEGGDAYALAVIDSTSAPHDDDSRNVGDGVGRGVIHLRVDAAGAPMAVRGSVQAAFRKHAFAIARPVGP